MPESRERVEEMLLEMFPKLKKSQARSLAASGDDISVLVTRVLDGNIERPFFDVAVLRAPSAAPHPSCPREYRYPEVFSEHAPGVDASACREQAGILYKQAEEMSRREIRHKTRQAAQFYSARAGELRAQAEECNRQAAIALMRRALQRPDEIDLHGLHAQEAVDFLEDLYSRRQVRDVTVVTGCSNSSQRVRPAVERWLRGKGFATCSQGPFLRGVKYG